MEKVIDLLDCPFCGKQITEDSLDMDDDSYQNSYWSVYCSCGVKNGWHDTPDEAIKAWNKRAYKPKK